ncbi:hypothetical protein ANTPLA_LOCUS10631 [Anthophora plagiata]
MALVTVQRSPSVSNSPQSSGCRDWRKCRRVVTDCLCTRVDDWRRRDVFAILRHDTRATKESERNTWFQCMYMPPVNECRDERVYFVHLLVTIVEWYDTKTKERRFL